MAQFTDCTINGINCKMAPDQNANPGAGCEKNVGAYYYKYAWHSNSDASRAASICIDLSGVELRPNSSTTYENHGYAFLSCKGQLSTPPEFGIYTTVAMEGKWYLYTRPAGGAITKRELVAQPDSTKSDFTNKIYKYAANTKVTLKINLEGTDLKGNAEWTGDISGNLTQPHTIAGATAGIEENKSPRTFFCGVSFVHQTAPTTIAKRGNYLKNIQIKNSKLYKEKNYTDSSLFIPGLTNPKVYYGLICERDYLTYSYNGSTTSDVETVSIDYTK